MGWKELNRPSPRHLCAGAHVRCRRAPHRGASRSYRHKRSAQAIGTVIVDFLREASPNRALALRTAFDTDQGAAGYATERLPKGVDQRLQGQHRLVLENGALAFLPFPERAPLPGC